MFLGKFRILIVCAAVLTAGPLVPSVSNVAAAVVIDSTSYRVGFGDWLGVQDAAAFDGSYRSQLQDRGQPARFRATRTTATTSVSLMTFKGPGMGQAFVTVDGVPQPKIDLYAPGPTVRTTIKFTTSSATSHTITVAAFGAKAAASTGTEVRIDGFKLGSNVFDDTSPSVAYGGWSAARNVQALNGSYRTGIPGATLAFDMTGSSFTFITERGPSFGKARVTVDGTSVGWIDCYAATTRWQSRQTFTGLTSGAHHVEIIVSATRNPMSTGENVVFDAITLL